MTEEYDASGLSDLLFSIRLIIGFVYTWSRKLLVKIAFPNTICFDNLHAGSVWFFTLIELLPWCSSIHYTTTPLHHYTTTPSHHSARKSPKLHCLASVHTPNTVLCYGGATTTTTTTSLIFGFCCFQYTLFWFCCCFGFFFFIMFSFGFTFVAVVFLYLEFNIALM